LKRALRRAVDAFMEELDKVTFEDAVTAPTVAASMLGLAVEAVPITLSRRADGAKSARSPEPVQRRRPRAGNLQ
jgi:Rrf2 family nitric oxide-sensitive transcriptional repressor